MKRLRVRLRYGREGLDVELPQKNVVAILEAPEVADVVGQKGVEQALETPIGSPGLEELCRGKKDACILISDVTRPVPNRDILPPLLAKLENCGIPGESITILVATGLHRPTEAKELDEMLGKDIPRKYRVINHNSRDREMAEDLGKTAAGTPIVVNRIYARSSLKIATGLIEPHLMAGFSGGRKAICPGICYPETMRVMHGPKMLASPLSTCDVVEGNPFHKEATEVANKVGLDFLVNVVNNQQRKAIGVFAGDKDKAFLEGVNFCRKAVEAIMSEPVDIVVTTCAGYPLDTTYYQSMKGMIGVLPILKPGGTIVIAAGCEEGLGSKEFTELVLSMPDLDTFERKLWSDGFFVIDQWQLQELCKVRKQAEVLFFTDKLDESLRERLLIPCVKSVEEGVEQGLRRLGAEAKIAVIPEGPYVLPRLAEG
jgi:nickel-dependent lactate racemase